MAQLAGMTLRERWSGWKREPFTSDSRHHVSVWELALSPLIGLRSPRSTGSRRVARSAGRAPARFQQALHPAAMATVGLQQFEHPLVGAAGLARQSPRHQVGQVVVPHTDGVGIAQRQPRGLGRGPYADAPDAPAAVRGTPRGPDPPTPRTATLARRPPARRRPRRVSTPNRWNANAGMAATRAGSGGSRRSASGPGAGSDAARTRPRHARRASIPVTFCSKMAAISVGTTAWVLREPDAAMLPPQVARSTRGAARTPRPHRPRPPGPAPSRGPTRRRGPRPRPRCPRPSARRRRVAAPSGVRCVRQASGPAIRVVASPVPRRSGNRRPGQVHRAPCRRERPGRHGARVRSTT